MSRQKRSNALDAEEALAEAERRIDECYHQKRTRLDLNGLGLDRLPERVLKLTRLQALQIERNHLTHLPEWLSELTQLRQLSLLGNPLRALPASLRRLHRLEYLGVQANHRLGLPAEIAKSHDARKILDYYFRIVAPGAAQPLNEFKLVLVGRGGVGKTTLVHRLVTNKYKEFKRTPGVKISQLSTRIDGDEVRAHVWDFGGQEILHGTHRFFMTERALYLVLISGRESTEDRDAEYWLSLIRSFAGDVPVLVLLHKWSDFQFELSKETLRRKYGPNLDFLETDSESGHGLVALREKICQSARNLPGLRDKWPVAWREIKEQLPRQQKNWLTFEEFCEFCSAHGVTESKDKLQLAESLHALGLMLSYQKEESLRGFGVLNPQWATQGIYQILNDPALKQAGGKFTVTDFAKVLPAESYPKALHPYLLALMRKFKLCHPLDDRGERHLIPELLTKEEPKLEAEFPPEECLGFVYRYDTVLPEGLLTRFIVETYVHREPKYTWRTGVVLERANCRALVRGDVEGRTVGIRVAGPGSGRRELLGIIREHFERIHASYEKLPVTELVPIPGHPLISVPYAELLDYESAKDDDYKVVIERKPVKLSVKELLDGVDVPGAIRRDSETRAVWSGLTMAGEPQVSLFISYSHKDELFRDELRGALTAYERRGEIQAWDDTCIIPGQKWEPEILGKLERARIIVLLLSNDFIRSDYCMQQEMKRALEREVAGECAIVPIVVRACPYEKLEMGKLQAIRPGSKPIKNHRDRDSAWLEVTKQLDRVIARLKKGQCK